VAVCINLALARSVAKVTKNLRITCQIKPGVKHEESVKLGCGLYVVNVKAQAIDGKANDAAQQLLARHFEVAPSLVVLVRGHTSKYKVFDVTMATSE
jgi:uncharacterized protein YggU (UPF0235/DUF167 family)